MSEQNIAPQEVEKSMSSPPIAAQTDWFLQELIKFSNNWGIEMSITLQVSGMLVSGTLISGTKFFSEFATQFSDGLKNNADLSKSFHELITSYTNIYTSDKEEDNRPPPQYIHLQNAKFYQPGQHPLPTDHGILWRGRVAEVGGFNLGSFS